jgi:penicillin-binding protein 2
LGLDALVDVSARFGFGQKTDIALLGETPGILAGREYYKQRFGYVAPGFVVNMAIGQGDISTSPIQIAVAYAAIANGGTIYKPQLVREIIDESGETVKRFNKEIKSTIADDSFNFDEIIEGLSFVAEPRGSAYSLRYDPKNADIAQWLKQEKISVVGKTGTAQVVKLSKSINHLKVEEVPYELRDHARRRLRSD